jgi:hypothetical protein
MGNRANVIVVENRDWQPYYSHCSGCRILDALIGGPHLALRYVQTATVREERVGGPRCGPTAARGELWPGFEIGWAYDGTVELAGYVGAELPPRDWDRQPTVRLARGRNHLCHLAGSRTRAICW